MKKTRVVKLLSIMLVLLLLMVSVVGCGKPNTSKEETGSNDASTTGTGVTEDTEQGEGPDISEPVVLKLMCVGDASPGEGSNMVADAVNKIIQPKINATIELEYLPWSDWVNKYQLIFASGEDFDGVYTANWSFYQAQATKNGFLEITDEMLNTYAPGLLTDLPAMAWEQTKVNGKIFMIPTTFSEFPTLHYAVREDLKEKYNVGDITDLESFGTYLQAIADNETNILPLNISVLNDYTSFVTLFNTEHEYGVIGNVAANNFVYKITNPGTEILNVFETPEFKDFVTTMYEWKNAGYWSKNAISNNTPASTAFENGTSAALLTNILAATNYSYSWPTEHPDWQVQVYDASKGAKQIGTPYIGSGLGIHSTSKNPERLLMFAELARTDKELNQLLCYGIKDTHWKLVGEDQVEYIRGNAAVDYTDGLSWFFRNSKFQLKPSGVYSNYDTIFETAKKNEIAHVLQGFNFDDTELKNEMAAISSVLTQYAAPLITGFVDPETGIDELNAKMKEAGADRVMEAIKQQAEQYIKDNQ